MSKLQLSDLIIERVCAFNTINIDTRDRKFRENRNLWAITLKTIGRTVYESGGKSYRSDPNHAVLLPKGSDYSFVCEEFGECLTVEFEAHTKNESKDLYVFPVNHMSELAAVFHRLEHLWTFQKPAHELKCMAGLYELFAKIEESELPPYQLSRKDSLLAPALSYIEEHYREGDLSNDLLAELCGISSVYLRKLFVGLYGASPQKYIQKIKIEKAKGMLLGDYASVSAIAEEAGFGSIYHFCKMFKKATGCTPREYAERKIN